ncbi:MAG: CopG family transcriptional regulator [Nanoarchaeota archaeon]|nr:CopG family transcriptional regulator [Nanoarchaeota archaeon]
MMYNATMTRTQIYLPESQLRELKKIAVKKNEAVSEIIRQMLRERLDKQGEGRNSEKSTSESLIEMSNRISKKWTAKGPRDLSSNTDKYIYGEI